VGKQVGRQVG